MQEILLKSWTNPYINTIFWNKYIHLSNLFTSCYKILSSITLMIFFFHVITSYKRILFWTRTDVSSQLFLRISPQSATWSKTNFLFWNVWPPPFFNMKRQFKLVFISFLYYFVYFVHTRDIEVSLLYFFLSLPKRRGEGVAEGHPWAEAFWRYWDEVTFDSNWGFSPHI